MTRWLVAALVLLLAPMASAGNVTLVHLVIVDYFKAGNWAGTIKASSTTPWPGFNPAVREERVLTSVDDVAESGLMIYRESELHRFVWTGPGALKGTAKVRDVLLGPGVYMRTWKIVGAEDAIAEFGCTSGCYPFHDFVLVPDVQATFEVGVRVALHLADNDTIAAMLAGQFGPPLVHRFSLPCVPLRIVGGVVQSTTCRND